MSLNRWSTLASFHRTMILRVCRLSLPIAAGGASIDAGVGVWGCVGTCAHKSLCSRAWGSPMRIGKGKFNYILATGQVSRALSFSNVAFVVAIRCFVYVIF